MKKSETRKLSQTRCPKCGHSGHLKEIIYGMPSNDFDFDKYAVGGCIIEVNAPNVECQNCGARWNFSN